MAAAIAAFIVPLPVSANVNDFSFSDFSVDYYLSRDDEGRSTMKVVETLTAEFPEFDQNKGIERAIPLKYDDHWVSLDFLSLTRNGRPEPIYEQRTESDNKVIATGTDDYVRGNQVYQFTYTLRDVTIDFGDHQELYWDTNGTGWSQPFGAVTARIHLDDSIKDSLNGQTACYQGGYGSSQECSVTVNDSEIVFTSTGQLAARENMTVVVGFNGGTFQPYSEGIYGIAKVIGITVAYALGLVALIWSVVAGRRRNQEPTGRGTIVPEYLPPNKTSLLISSNIIAANNKVLAAQVVDLAVRHFVRIIEIDNKKKKYSLELLKTEGLMSDELDFVRVLFPSLNKGDIYEFKAHDQKVTVKLYGQLSKVPDNSVKSGYRRKAAGYYKPAILSVVGLVVAIVLLAYLSNFIYTSNIFVIVALGLTLICGITLAIGAPRRPLTDKGVELRDYLKGLKMYIVVAEADRLKVLQSPQGAEKTPIDISDKAKIVRLYERVLPYAILFNQEKGWAKQLTFYYENSHMEPDWYRGMSAFNAAVFVSSISNFSASAVNTFSMPTSSSSSGLGGGGFSGGGGGGGGGGGR